MSNKSERVWCVIPAAGTGSRMGGVVPKQYLHLAGKTVLDHTVGVFSQMDQMSGIAVGIAPDDDRWQSSGMKLLPDVHTFLGGDSRAGTVYNGLEFLISGLSANHEDWVMVHDAARPLVDGKDIVRLLSTCRKMDCGGILATPVVDTMKSSDGNMQVVGTERRESLWRALTPQCFRLGLLHSAMHSGLNGQISMTDESSAMEHCGHPVRLVPGSARNIKITTPDDLEFANFLLRS